MPRKTRQNDITSPALLSQVNPDNMRLKKDFVAYLQSVQRSPKTIAGYENDLDIFWVWNLQYKGNKFFPKISTLVDKRKRELSCACAQIKVRDLLHEQLCGEYFGR